jgi:hypothetical protein
MPSKVFYVIVTTLQYDVFTGVYWFMLLMGSVPMSKEAVSVTTSSKVSDAYVSRYGNRDRSSLLCAVRQR